MTVFLHIGSTKTGTTSLQRFLASNRLLLRKHGYRYPRFLGKESHQKLAVYAHELRQHEAALRLGVDSPETLQRFRNELEAEVQERLSGDSDHLILSSEHCSAILNSPLEIARLQSLLARIGADIKVIFYARQQAEFLVSEYSTNIVKGRTHSMTYPGKDNLERNFNYFAILSRWESVFGRDAIVARLFDKKTMAKGNVIHDFCQTVGLGDDFLEAAEEPPQLNESLDHVTVEFLRHFNALVPSRVGNWLNPDRGNIGQLVRSMSKRERIAIPPRIVERLREELLECNGQFRERYIDGVRSDPFDWDTRSDARPIRELDTEEVYQLFAAIWVQKVQEARKPKKK